MPRDGSGIYSYPVGTPGIPGAVIESAKYNTYIADIQFDLNFARPINVGGTGATTAAEALTNLGGELARQIVTNYDSHAFLSGSFYSETTAVASPVAGHRFMGVVIQYDANNIVLQAVDLDSTPQPPYPWTRVKSAGTWSTWKQTILDAVAPELGDFVEKSGDTMTGPLQFNSVVGVTVGATNRITGQHNGVARWDLMLGEGSAENASPANTGSLFSIRQYNNAGSQVTFSAQPMLFMNRDAPQRLTVQNLQVGTDATVQTMSSFQPAIWTRRIFLTGAARIGFNASFDASSGNYRQISSGNASGFLSYGSSFKGNGFTMQVSTFDGAAGAFVDPATYAEAAWISPGEFSVSATYVAKPGGGLWNDSSDARIKHNIKDYAAGLGEILKLRPRVYSFKEETGRDHRHRYVGLVAQEAERVMPEMIWRKRGRVGEMKLDDLRFMDGTALIYALINAVKTLNARLDAMEERQR